MIPESFDFEAWLGREWTCVCGRTHRIPVRHIAVKNGAAAELPDYVRKRGWQRVALIGDEHTFAAAEGALRPLNAASSIQAVRIELKGKNGGLAADGDAILQALVGMPKDTEALVAVGSGTLHDIARFVSSVTGKPFLSVPTAASVDGFVSAGAPLIVNGFKTTIQSHAPEAVFADPGLLASAPQTMSAAGFGDMLGKFTSLADWQLGRTLFGEYHCPLAEEWTRQGLRLALANREGIGRAEPDALAGLMEGLLLSGLAMLAVHHSRPASGAEHHLSHYWEMEFLHQGRPAVLHGAKVGVATVLMAERYARIARQPQAEAAANLRAAAAPTEAQLLGEIERGFGPLAPAVSAEYFGDACSEWQDPPAFRRRLEAMLPQVEGIAREVPRPDLLRAWLKQVGGPAEPQEVGVNADLTARALRYAKFIRSRYTVLRLADWLLPGG